MKLHLQLHDAKDRSAHDAVSEAQDNVEDFERAVDEEEDIDEMEEEDTPDPFWLDLISRAGTFDVGASQEKMTQKYLVSGRYFVSLNPLENRK
ncbi:hypothetical protein R1flu_008943 [Riccia fluitans]|uniref:Uncharacterized protein n=1 Tax=Riccia fluitans TaxID=41844 RepID=A0ABD1Z156_9MARC